MDLEAFDNLKQFLEGLKLKHLYLWHFLEGSQSMKFSKWS